MKEYKISAELLQSIVNLLQEMPAKHSFLVLKLIDELIKAQTEKQ